MRLHHWFHLRSPSACVSAISSRRTVECRLLPIFQVMMVVGGVLFTSLTFAGSVTGRVVGPDGIGVAHAVVFVQALPAGVALPKSVPELLRDRASQEPFLLMLGEERFLVIEREKGVIDKYIGDEVMAIFGTPLPQPDHPVRAVAAAIGMLRELERFNAEQRERSTAAPVLRIGIGVASGPVVAGNVGSPERLNYTILGDTVNIASCLQGLTKEYHTPLIMSEATYQYVAEQYPGRWLGTVAVRGRQEKTKLYTVEL